MENELMPIKRKKTHLSKEMNNDNKKQQNNSHWKHLSK